MLLNLTQFGQPRRRIVSSWAFRLISNLKLSNLKSLPPPKLVILSAAKDLNAANRLHPFPLPNACAKLTPHQISYCATKARIRARNRIPLG